MTARVKDWIGAAAPLVAALVVAAPALAVLASLAAPVGDVMRHILGTVGAGYLINTTILCLAVGTIGGALGVAAALLVALCEFPGRRTLSLALVLPLATPAYIAAYAWADLLGPFGLLAPLASGLAAIGLPGIKSLAGAAFVLSLASYPYAYLAARAAFAGRSAAAMETARTLGARPLAATFSLLLPMARPAIAGGVALIMMETAAEFGVADFFGVPTLSVGIFRTWHSFGDLLAASQLASALFLFALTLVAFEAAGRRGRTSDAPRGAKGAMRFALTGGGAAAASLFCAGLVGVGFIAPVATIAVKVDPGFWTIATRGLARTLSNSVSIAAAGAATTMIIALALSYASRFSRARVVAPSLRAATLGYAVPGAVIAIGILAVFSFLRDAFGFAPAFVAGPVALIYAYAVRFLTAGYNAANGGLVQIDPGLDGAARTLGAGPFRIARAVHAPLLRPALASGAIIVFVDIVKELPATLILRQFNFETLATRVYRLAGDERLAEAAPEALILIALGAAPIVLLNALADGKARLRAK